MAETSPASGRHVVSGFLSGAGPGSSAVRFSDRERNVPEGSGSCMQPEESSAAGPGCEVAAPALRPGTGDAPTLRPSALDGAQGETYRQLTRLP